VFERNTVAGFPFTRRNPRLDFRADPLRNLHSANIRSITFR
jgi:hypothetical protein